MGRYYHGDIEGKFWFAVQSSDDGEYFGMRESQSYIEYYSRNYDLKCSIIRPGNVYGPGQNFEKSQGIISHSIYTQIGCKEWVLLNKKSHSTLK